MVARFSRFRTRLAACAVAAFAVAWLVALAAPAGAQQPTSVNPTASAVKEEQLLNALRSGDAITGRGTIPDAKAQTLIQPGGIEWTVFHQTTMLWIGAIAVLGAIALVLVFWMMRGKIRLESGFSGIKILRFNGFERFVHWLTAACFIVLALSGLNITFGKYLLLPLIGADAFTWLSQWGKYAHNYLAFPFMIGLVFMLVVWIAHNFPNKYDMEWLKQGGGLFKEGAHPPSKKFNAGQKLIFWSVIIGGAALSITGVFLLFPFQFAVTMGGMQLAQIIHGLVSVILIGIMVGHIYIGSVGMEGAFDAMGTGEVDLNWAKEHHSVWVEEAQKKQAQMGGPTPQAMPAE